MGCCESSTRPAVEWGRRGGAAWGCGGGDGGMELVSSSRVASLTKSLMMTCCDLFTPMGIALRSAAGVSLARQARCRSCYTSAGSGRARIRIRRRRPCPCCAVLVSGFHRGVCVWWSSSGLAMHAVCYCSPTDPYLLPPQLARADAVPAGTNSSARSQREEP